MNLQLFKIVNSEENQQLEGPDYDLLINVDNIASVKPINIIHKGNVIHGFWIRLSNGKKYRATRIPNAIFELFKNEITNLTSLSLNESKSNTEVGNSNENQFIQ